MSTVAVLYATREGQTRIIAEFLAASLRSRAFDAVARNVAEAPAIDVGRCAAIVLAASVHAGKHEPEMVQFVKQNLAALSAIPSAFLSVTLSEAGAERVGGDPAAQARSAADVQKMIAEFEIETGWHAHRVKPVAGALLYSRYNFIIRFVMKRIARQAGAETDTSRDYEYTDWKDLERFAGDFCKEIPAEPGRAPYDVAEYFGISPGAGASRGNLSQSTPQGERAADSPSI